MIALTIILVIIAVAGFAVTTALRKACDPSNRYENQARKKIAIVRGAILGVCAVVFGLGVLINGIKIIISIPAFREEGDNKFQQEIAKTQGIKQPFLQTVTRNHSLSGKNPKVD